MKLADEVNRLGYAQPGICMEVAVETSASDSGLDAEAGASFAQTFPLPRAGGLSPSDTLLLGSRTDANGR